MARPRRQAEHHDPSRSASKPRSGARSAREGAETFIVSGRVLSPAGAPGADLKIVASGRDLRSDSVLGETRTGIEGAYELDYPSPSPLTDGLARVALLIRAFSDDGELLAESEPRFDPGPREEIDLVVPVAEKSEWELLAIAVSPLLERQDITPAELTDDDLDFIAGDRGVDREHLQSWAWAFRAAVEHRLLRSVGAARAAFKPLRGLAEAAAEFSLTNNHIANWLSYYAWASEGLPQEVEEIFARTTESLVETVRHAVGTNVVPASVQDSLEALAAAIDRTRADLQLRRQSPDEPARLGDLLDTVSPDWLEADQRRKLVDLVARIDPGAPDFPEHAEKAGLDASDALLLTRTLRLAKLVGDHLPTIEALQPFIADDTDASLGGLAKLTTGEWIDLAYSRGAPEGLASEADVFGLRLRDRAEHAAPEAALRARLAEGSVLLTGAGFASVGRFLENNTGFSFASDDPEDFVATADMTGIDEPREDVASALGQLQALKRAGIRWAETPTFVAAGVSSLETLADLGPEALARRVGAEVDPQRVGEIALNAKLMKTAGIGMMSAMLPVLNGTSVEVVLPPELDGQTREVVDSSPSLRRLFGALERCACDPCESVLSPSAYLADLLSFVGRDNGVSWHLQQRRADIYDLELSCPNAQVELPHIDLVNELLENAVALPYELLLPSGLDVVAGLKQHPYPAAIVDALQETTWEPVIEASLSAEIYPEPRSGVTRVVISDRYRRWVLEVRGGYFGPLGHSGKKFEASEGKLKQLVAALDDATVTSLDTSAYFGSIALGGSTLPGDVVAVDVAPVEQGRRWRIGVTVAGDVAIDDTAEQIRYSAADATVSRGYSAAALSGTRTTLEQERLGGVAQAEALDPGNYVITPGGPDAWHYSKSVLHDYVYIPVGVVITSLAYQTADDRDLRARPQHRNPRAYRNFLARSDAVYPWTLPYDVDLDEVRSLLAAAGLRRADLMRAALPPDDDARRGVLAIERLGMSRAELTLADSAAADADVWKRWGLKVQGTTATILDTYDDTQRTAPPLELLSTVSILLQQARLTFLELEWLLQSEFVNPGRAAKISLPADATSADECDLTKVEVDGSSTQLFDRLHRFVRWQRRLKWTTLELDIALRAIGSLPGQTSEKLAESLADIDALRERLDVPIETLLTAFYGFDRVTYRHRQGDSIRVVQPLYERVFQNPETARAGTSGTAGTRAPDPALAYDTLTAATSTVTIGDHAAAVAAAVGLHTHDVLPLLNADFQLASPPATVDETTLLTVSQLQILLRDTALARALHVPPSRLATLVDLRGRRPFDSPSDLLEFCDDVDFIAASGFDPDQLRYVLTHRGPQSFAWVFTEDHAVRILQALQVALRDADAEAAGTAGSDSLTPAQLSTLRASTTSKAQRIAILQELTQFGEYELERIALSLWPSFDDAFTTDDGVRELVDVAVTWHRRAAIVAVNLAQAFGIDASLATSLLWFHLRASTNVAAIEVFADPKPRTPAQRFDDASRTFDVATVAQTPEFRVLVKLHKFGVLNGAWRLTQSELARFPGSALGTGTLLGLPFDSLPVTASYAAFTDWKRSAILLRLSRSSRGLDTVIDEYAQAIEATGVDPVAAGATVWSSALDLPVASVRDLAGVGILDFDANNAALQECRDPLRIGGWYEIMLLARSYGLGADDVKLLIAESPAKQAIDAAVRALQARFGEQAREVMVKAADALRASRRDRLVDYLLWRDELRDAEALYERYLLDVEMAPCTTTTRLLQAVAGVQLYVQRCLMNLEPAVDPAAVDPDRHWEWRKNYRVWEANRKIFLYPENWLHPELRDDKSEIYRSFESALTQAEASDANAVTAVQGYLENLLDIAQISVMGMYEEAPRTNGAAGSGAARRTSKTLHVVGRSPDPPYSYFYRRNEQNGEPGSRWTAWERISLDLPSCHVVPFSLGGELHLVWPIVELEQDAQANKSYYNIRLAWSRHTSLGWTQRKVATDTATRIEKHFNRDERGSVALRLLEPQPGTGSVAVELYVARKTPSVIDESQLAANTVQGQYEEGEVTSTYLSDWTFKASSYVKYRDTSRIDVLAGAHFRIVGLREPNPSANEQEYHFGVYGGASPDRAPATPPGFPADGSAVALTVHNDAGDVLLEGTATIDGALQTVVTSNTFHVDPSRPDQHGTGSVWGNLLFSATKDPDFDDPGIDQFARVKMDLAGRFWFEAGRDTRWIPSSTGGALAMPDEALSWESRFRERNHYTPAESAGLHAPDGSEVFPQSESAATYLSLRAARPGPSGTETWYWEESSAGSTTRFLRLSRDTTPASMITVQPAGFEDSREYRYRYADGPAELFTPQTQDAPTNGRFGVDALPSYFPSALPTGVDPRTVPLLQFHLGMPYGSYNWEVFYHLPMAAARFLATQQRFAEAQRWLTYVFDPTSNDPSPGRERYWRCLPLRHSNTPLALQQLMRALADPNADPATTQQVHDQVVAWEANPFSPFAVARVRMSAYEWYSVIAYVRNLIEWGDSLYRRDTREAINEAALLYVFAAKILGRRPRVVPPLGFRPGPVSYRALAGHWDEFSNAWVRLIDTPLGRAMLAWLLALQKLGGFNPHAWDQQIEQLSSIGALYFCIPRNDRLDSLWDTVEDRLWKIRHCQNIDGVARPLSLLDPPIDPELLIRARLAGIAIDDVLADLYAPPPHYRYAFLAQKAVEFCGELKALGAALLAAIEKKDVEQLGLLRSTQEIAMLGLVEAVKLDQVAEAEANIQAIEQTRLNVIAQYRYLQRMLGATDVRFDARGVPVMDQHGTLQVRDASAPGDFRGLALVQSEVDQVSNMQEAHIATIVGGALKAGAAAGRGTAAVLSAYGLMSQPAAQAAYFIAQALFDLGDVSALVATNADLWSRRSALIASFQRRREEWIQQSAAAVDEIREIDKQLAAANIRKAIADKELANHRRSIQNAREIDDYLRERKFSSAERYAWMETQLLSAYHGAYQVAFDLAKRAERAWRRELGETDSQWIKFGYWDGAKKGLLAGEQLHLDLSRMEVAYLDRSKREYEITRHVSLLALDPGALIELHEAGSCHISVPEALFDLDFPGHYFRRLKAVSVSIPCVVGPYSGVAATLKLVKSSIRTSTAAAAGYLRVDPDPRFVDVPGGVEAVVTSSGLNDSGLFETNLHDERFLPFEGAGAISTWELKLPDEFRAFDYDTISDVILHLRYTAREGGEDLKTTALADLTTALNAIARLGAQQGFARLFSLRRDFPSEWRRLATPADVTVDSKVDVTLAKNRFPFLFNAKNVKLTIEKVAVLAVPSKEAAAPQFPAFVKIFPPGAQDALEWDTSPISIGSLAGRSAQADVVVSSSEQSALWRFEVPQADVATLSNDVEDLMLVCQYTITRT